MWPRDGINNGDRHRPKAAAVRAGDAGTGELQELAEPPPPPPLNDAKLDWDGDGVRISLPPPLKVEVPGDEQRMSREAARNGDGERLLLRRG